MKKRKQKHEDILILTRFLPLPEVKTFLKGMYEKSLYVDIKSYNIKTFRQKWWINYRLNLEVKTLRVENTLTILKKHNYLNSIFGSLPKWKYLKAYLESSSHAIIKNSIEANVHNKIMKKFKDEVRGKTPGVETVLQINL